MQLTAHTRCTRLAVWKTVLQPAAFFFSRRQVFSYQNERDTRSQIKGEKKLLPSACAVNGWNGLLLRLLHVTDSCFFSSFLHRKLLLALFFSFLFSTSYCTHTRLSNRSRRTTSNGALNKRVSGHNGNCPLYMGKRTVRFPKCYGHREKSERY